MNGYPSRRPEDRELIGKRAKWVNQEEIDARRQERRCLRCGRNNCRIATCPLAAALRPTHVSVKTAKSTVVTKAAVEEEDPETPKQSNRNTRQLRKNGRRLESKRWIAIPL
ncbi:Retrotransposon gag protein [Pyrenophora tritici-repentis]|uniref:Retrotransposon gag protein n=1 Tax=Pyrenophora tritici-repentis TaxID=45151 RepID=A0A922N6T8_9PLEO|nr:Retrotransposon gag protein [Pyrenophora tritici-repentis]